MWVIVMLCINNVDNTGLQKTLLLSLSLFSFPLVHPSSTCMFTPLTPKSTAIIILLLSHIKTPPTYVAVSAAVAKKSLLLHKFQFCVNQPSQPMAREKWMMLSRRFKTAVKDSVLQWRRERVRSEIIQTVTSVITTMGDTSLEELVVFTIIIKELRATMLVV